ncbi:hypothetical protein EJB05_46991, partial [Eragrostis curvula]
MGAYRELELTLLSARDLKNVNLITRMDVYAVASISGDPMTRQCTPPDPSGGRNPSWNSTLRFSVPASASAAGGGWLHVLLRSERALGDRDIGEVVVPLAELLAGADGPAQQPPRLASYQVHTVHRGEPRGVLNVSYRLGHVVAPVKQKGAEGDKSPVIAYPVPPQAAADDVNATVSVHKVANLANLEGEGAAAFFTDTNVSFVTYNDDLLWRFRKLTPAIKEAIDIQCSALFSSMKEAQDKPMS